MDENNNNMDFSWLDQPLPPAPPEPPEAAPPAEPIQDPAPASSPQEEAALPPYQNPFAQPPQQPWAGGYAPQQNWQAQPQAWQPPAYHTQAWGQPTQNNSLLTAPQPAQKQQKRKKTGLAIFLVFLVLLVGVGTAVGVKLARSDFQLPAFGATEEANSDARMTTLATPSGLSSSDVKGKLSASEISEKLKNSNVLVQVYGSQGTLAGEGSGILLMEDDTKTFTYVVTCAHVIDGQSKVSVELENGDSYEATFVAADNRTDVGLLKIKKTGLQLAPFGDSNALKVGETVYAIGNPGGAEFKGTFTPGMVSAIDRPIKGSYKQVLIQHTAAINPGNSGGMLVNAAGQVIGINSQKIVDTQYEGMGFAIPAAVATKVVNDLIKYQRVPNRPKLGIQYGPANETQLGYFLIRMRNLPSGSLIISKIDSDSAFNNTDVQVNDIITHVNGKPLTSADVLLSAVENSKVGGTLKLSIVRVSQNYDIKEFEVTVKLVEDKGVVEEPTTEMPNFDFFEQYGDQFGW